MSFSCMSFLHCWWDLYSIRCKGIWERYNQLQQNKKIVIRYDLVTSNQINRVANALGGEQPTSYKKSTCAHQVRVFLHISHVTTTIMRVIRPDGPLPSTSNAAASQTTHLIRGRGDSLLYVDLFSGVRWGCRDQYQLYGRDSLRIFGLLSGYL